MRNTLLLLFAGVAGLLAAPSALGQSGVGRNDHASAARVLSARPQGHENENPTIKVDVKLVSVFATVTDATGAPVTDLHKEDFELREDGVKQKIAVFEQQSELPLSIVIGVDTSGSVRKDFPLEIDSARRFISSILRSQDRLSMLEVSEVVEEIVPFTSSLKTIDRGIKKIQMGAGTALYDAIYLGGESLIDRQGRKVMVLITDGGDTMSKTNYSDAVRAAQQAEAIVYSIIVVPIEADAGRNTGGEHALIQLSRDTGGKHYYAQNIGSLNRAFQQISRELRTQYLLGYYPSQRIADSDFRQIDIKVAPADGGLAADKSYKVNHRTGYYTSKMY